MAFEDPDLALIALAERLRIVDTEQRAAAVDRVLAHAVLADRDSPAADVSAMDGFAVRMEMLQSSACKVVGAAQAGAPPIDMPRNGCVSIFTGALVPTGADAVVIREDTDESQAGQVTWLDRAKQVQAGANIRRRGENGKQGEPVLEAGTRVTAAALSAIHFFGAQTVSLYRPVRVAVIVTGNELLGIESQPQPWQIRDSNGAVVAGACARHAWLDCLQVTRCDDDLDSLSAALEQALQMADAVILTGGVSKGDYDHVPAAITRCGCETVFHRLPIRPARPILGAVSPQGQLVLGLPGNPVSAAVGMTKFGLPLLAKMSGSALWRSRPLPVTLTNPSPATLPLHWYRLVKQDSSGAMELVKTQGSGDIVSLATSDGFIHQAPEHSGPGLGHFTHGEKRSWDELTCCPIASGLKYTGGTFL